MRALSRHYYPAKGTDYPIVFPYGDAKEIGVTVGGVPMPSWSLLHAGMLRLSVVPEGVVCVYSTAADNMAADDQRQALGVDHSDGLSFHARFAKISNLAGPTNPADAATKAYVDAAVEAAVQKLKSEIVEQLIAVIEHGTASDAPK